jgi:hypothetical protein
VCLNHWVLAVEPAHAGELVVKRDRVTGRLQPRSPGIDVVNQQAGMCVARGPEVRLDPQMQLDASRCSSMPAPRNQHPPYPKHIFGVRGTAQQYVVNHGPLQIRNLDVKIIAP